jgi:hypothetical protein
MNSFYFKGIKAKEFPREPGEQKDRATELVSTIVQKVLNREETFSIAVRKTQHVRYAKNSTLILVPPIEVKVEIVEEEFNCIYVS